MRDLMKRLGKLEAEAHPSGVLLQPWTDEAGGAKTCYLGQAYRQEPGEALEAFLDRAGAAIARRPLVWVNQADARL